MRSTVWWCGELQVGHGGLVRRRSNASLRACQAGVGAVVGFGHGGWVMLDHCSNMLAIWTICDIWRFWWHDS